MVGGDGLAVLSWQMMLGGDADGEGCGVSWWHRGSDTARRRISAKEMLSMLCRWRRCCRRWNGAGGDATAAEAAEECRGGRLMGGGARA